MLISFLVLALLALGGMALTYLIADDETFMWRLAVGNVIGAAILGLSGFILASFFGLNAGIVIAALVITLLPLILLTRKKIGFAFRHDWAKAKGKLQGGNLKRFAGFGYYAFFLVLFWLFFGHYNG